MTSQNRTLEQRWQRFRIGDIFEKCSMNRIKKPVSQLSKHRTVNNDTPVLTASTKNRGFACYASRVDTNSTSRNVISIVEKGTGKAYYHSADFAIASGVYVIQPKCKAIQCDEVGLFFETCINKAIKYACFSWFIPARFPDVSDLYITLPVNKNGEIDYEYMISLMHDVIVQCSVDIEHKFNDIINMYLKETVLKNFELTEEDKEVLIKFIGNDGVTKQDVLKLISGFTPPREKPVDKLHFKMFRIDEIFKVSSTKSLDAGAVTFYSNGVNFVGRTNDNNGIQGKIKLRNYEPNEANTISVTVIGNYKYVKYQEKEYYCSQNINKLILLNKFNTKLNYKIALYLIALIKKFTSTYNGSQSGYKLKDLSEWKILLPVNEYGEPDFVIMSKFITAIEKIVIKDMAKKIEQEQQCLRQITEN